MSPNFHIHVSVSNFNIPRIGLPIMLQPNRQTDPGNIYIANRYCTGMQELRTRPRSFISGNTKIGVSVQCRAEITALMGKLYGNAFHPSRNG